MKRSQKKLAKHYKSIDAIAKASEDELTHVDEIGKKIAESVVSFFWSLENIIIIDRLKQFGVQLEVSAEQLLGQTDKLKGDIIVVTGVFETVSRDELKKLIEDNGGKVSSSISTKTSYIIAGSNMGPSKKEKAEKLGIRTIKELEFLHKIKNNR